MPGTTASSDCSYVLGEARTTQGQHIEFTCPGDKREEVKAFLAANVRTIALPKTSQADIPHGGKGRYSRYKIVQHNYAGGGSGGVCGYIEVLEIENPPDGRRGIVIHTWKSNRGSTFFEWGTLSYAFEAFKKLTFSDFSKMPGFVRQVECGDLTPWFYAVGDQLLIGDYAFPEGVQDDPVYVIGRKFIFEDGDGIKSIKTCMGTRFLTRPASYRPERDDPEGNQHYRLVYFSDGSIWDERGREKRPIPIQHEEEWICEAMSAFLELLNGRTTGFSIRFLDGGGLTCKLAGKARRNACPEGLYQVTVHLKGKKPKSGSVDFKPSPEHPDVVSLVKSHFEAKGGTVLKITITGQKATPKGRKWLGPFFKL
jgi:hypothetical protein